MVIQEVIDALNKSYLCIFDIVVYFAIVELQYVDYLVSTILHSLAIQNSSSFHS